MSDSIKKWHEMQEEKDSRDTIVDPIVEDVISKMRSRSEVGIKKYGTTLHSSPDGFYAFLNHLQEELTDAILYIEKLKKQR